MASVSGSMTEIGAFEDLDDAKIWKRRVRLAVAGVDDDALGAVGDADVGAKRGGRGQDGGQYEGGPAQGSMSRH
jgi:hypothetical protein